MLQLTKYFNMHCILTPNTYALGIIIIFAD